jgi:hypothetical protein
MDQIKLPTNEELAKKMAEAKGLDEYPKYRGGLNRYWCSKSDEYNHRCSNCNIVNLICILTIIPVVLLLAFAMTLIVREPTVLNFSWFELFGGVMFSFLFQIILVSVTTAAIWWKRRKTYQSCLEELGTEKGKLRYLLPVVRQMTIDAFDHDIKELCKVEDAYLKEHIQEELRTRETANNSVGNDSVLLGRIAEKNNKLMKELGDKINNLELEKVNAVRKLEEAYYSLVLNDMDSVHNSRMPPCDRSLKMIDIVNGLVGLTNTVPAPSAEPPPAPPIPPPASSPDVSCSDVVAS